MNKLPTLSILICTLPENALLLEQLQKAILPDGSPWKNRVEVIFDDAPRGTKEIGAKRNDLLSFANGDYVAFIDDDDHVHPKYIDLVLDAIQTKPDCVGIEGVILFDLNYPRRFIHSITCAGWYESRAVYFRTPNHLNPTRREIAQAVGYAPLVSFGEDSDYAQRLFPYLKSEVFIRDPLYYYLYGKHSLPALEQAQLEVMNRNAKIRSGGGI